MIFGAVAVAADHKRERADEIYKTFTGLLPDRFPLIAAHAAQMVADDSDERFRFAIDVVIDGVVARAPRRNTCLPRREGHEYHSAAQSLPSCPFSGLVDAATSPAMSEPERMPAVTFRGTRNQRGFRTGATIFCLLIGVTVLVLAHRAGNDSKGLVIVGVLFLVLASLGVLGRGARTTIDGSGIRTSLSLKRNRSIAWSDIADIETKTSWADEDWSQRVRIKPYSGRPFSLPEPSDSSGSMSNPHFNEDVATIRDYWQRGRAASGRYQDQVP